MQLDCKVNKVRLQGLCFFTQTVSVHTVQAHVLSLLTKYNPLAGKLKKIIRVLSYGRKVVEKFHFLEVQATFFFGLYFF